MTTVDYLSAINSRGSGLNITQIVDSLVEAEKAPQENSIQTRIEQKTPLYLQLVKSKAHYQNCQHLYHFNW